MSTTLCGHTMYTIYTLHSAGDVTIPGGMTLTEDSDLNGESPQLTLTCTSTGGPATTVIGSEALRQSQEG